MSQMRVFFTLFFFVLLNSVFGQSSQITPNGVIIPSVTTFPAGSSGSLVFKVPENALFTYDGTSWKQLQVVSQEGFSSSIGSYNNCCTYPNSPSNVYLNTPSFQLGNGVFSNNSYKVDKSGLYQFSASFTTSTFDSTPPTFFLTIYIFKHNNMIRLNSFNNQSSAKNSTSQCSDFIYLNSGDIIEMKIAHNYTGGMGPNPTGSFFSLIKMY